MRIAVASAAACLIVLAGCQSDPDDPDPTPVESVPGESPTPDGPTPSDPPEEPLTVESIAGSWSNDAEPGQVQTINLNADGTYTLDVGEAEHISSGQFTLEGNTITFVEGEADGIVGQIESDQLVTDQQTYTKQP